MAVAMWIIVAILILLIGGCIHFYCFNDKRDNERNVLQMASQVKQSENVVKL